MEVGVFSDEQQASLVAKALRTAGLDAQIDMKFSVSVPEKTRARTKSAKKSVKTDYYCKEHNRYFKTGASKAGHDRKWHPRSGIVVE